jgi:hypothetical protein
MRTGGNTDPKQFTHDVAGTTIEPQVLLMHQLHYNKGQYQINCPIILSTWTPARAAPLENPAFHAMCSNPRTRKDESIAAAAPAHMHSPARSGMRE